MAINEQIIDSFFIGLLIGVLITGIFVILNCCEKCKSGKSCSKRCNNVKP